MQSLEDIVKKLQGSNHSEIARESGLTRAYVNAIAKGKHLNPRYETVKKLSEALEDEIDK